LSRLTEQTLAYLNDRRRELEEETMAEQDQRIQEAYELDQLMKTGKTCRKFLESEIGRFLLDRAAQHGEVARDKLARMNRLDYESDAAFVASVQEAQYEARVPNLLFTWVTNAIEEAAQEDILTKEEG
jgi:hypothetical protein